MKIIGLGHYSRTGKDTLANALIDSLREQSGGKIRVAKKPFAWKLKEICHELYGWDGLQGPEFYDIKENEYLRDVPLPTIGKTPVQIWVDFGTPAVRQNVYQDTWIDYLLKTPFDLDVLIVPDVRFPNEVSAMRAVEAVLSKVVRPGYGPRPTVADRALVGYTGWDYFCGGSGSMDELRRWGSLFATGILSGRWPTQTDAEKRQANSVEVITEWTPPTARVSGLTVDPALAKRIIDLNTLSVVHGAGGLDGEILERLIAVAAAA